MWVKALKGFGLPGGRNVYAGDVVELPDVIARQKIALGKMVAADEPGPAPGAPDVLGAGPELDTRAATTVADPPAEGAAADEPGPAPELEPARKSSKSRKE